MKNHMPSFVGISGKVFSGDVKVLSVQWLSIAWWLHFSLLTPMGTHTGGYHKTLHYTQLALGCASNTHCVVQKALPALWIGFMTLSRGWIWLARRHYDIILMIWSLIAWHPFPAVTLGGILAFWKHWFHAENSAHFLTSLSHRSTCCDRELWPFERYSAISY